MIRYHHLISFFCWVFIAIPASAQVNCSVFDALERVQFAQSRLSTGGNFTPNTGDAALVVSELRKLQIEHISSAQSGKLSKTDTATLGAYLSAAQTLGAMITSRDQAGIATYFSNPAFDAGQRQIATILPRLGCNPLTKAGRKGGDQRVLSALKQTQGGRLFTVQTTLIALALIGVIIVFSLRLDLWWALRRARLSRQSKRYATHLESKISHDNTIWPSLIVDLSCNGAKMQIHTQDLLQIGQHIEVWIDDAWHLAKLHWANQHYIGLRFDHPIAHDRMQTIRKQHHPNKKAAPDMAPLS